MSGARTVWARVSLRVVVWSAAVASLCAAPPAPAAEGPPAAVTLRDETIGAAIDSIAAELLRRKDARRFWEPTQYDDQFESRQQGGWTALAVLALLQSGLSYQDERLRDAVEYLEGLSMRGTYAVAVRAHVWAVLPNRFRPRLEQDVKWLSDSFVEKRGGWYYEQKPPPNQIDNSNTQYGALGLWEGGKRGVAVPPRLWQLLEDRFVQNQRGDGGWNYQTDGVSTGSMTTAGLTVLFITQDLLHGSEYLELRPQAARPATAAIERGLRWMDRHFSADANPGKDSHFFYYLYGVERVALASGHKHFGGHDWYHDGARAIIDRLCVVDAATGTVTIKPAITAKAGTGEGPVADLAFALMFLSRGRVPVAINKLRDPAAAWNNRPRDAANLTAWIQDRTETALNWQIVDISRPAEQWLDAPLLYMASDAPLPWLDRVNIDVRKLSRDARAQRQQAARGAGSDAGPTAQAPRIEPLERLKHYLDLGGTLLAVNEGTSRRFVESMEKAGQIMYPLLEWRPLPEDHWVYTLLFPIQGRRPQLRGLCNGVRELIILWPAGDLPRSLQGRDERAEAAFAVAGNVYLYASERNQPRPRLAGHFVALPAPAPHAGAVTIARGMYDGNWNPEPMALPVFAAVMRSARALPLTVVDQALSRLHELTPRPPLTIVSGVDKHQFTAEELASIKAYVAAGGVMFFETAGGMGEFATAAEETMAGVFNAPPPGASPGALLRSRIITGEDLPRAARLSRVEYRAFAQERWGSRETAPRLRGIIVDGQPRILFSREDCSHALLDQPCWGVSGYSPQSARDVLSNVVLHAAALAPSGPSIRD